MNKNNVGRTQRLAFRALPFILIILSLACSLPTVGKLTPTSIKATITSTTPPTPTPTPQPLPPALVETNPPQGVAVPLKGPITLYFNQAMDRASVETALTSQLKQDIHFTWVDDQTVALYPSAPLTPETEVALNLGAEAHSAQGLGLLAPVSLSYRTAGYLRLSQTLPETKATDVDPSSAIVAAFNQPIVPLGADPGGLPVAFSLEPAAQGQGEWINTSTYIFYPDPPLAGGRPYSVIMNPDLKSTDGSPLQEVKPWTFTTLAPRLLTIEPSTETPWRLDAKVQLSFNQPMSPTSVEANFSLSGPGNKTISGKITWNEDETVLTFTPTSLLERNTNYSLKLNGAAQSGGGTPLGSDAAALVGTMPDLQVYRSEPVPGGSIEPQGQEVSLYFSSPVQDKGFMQFITIEPAVHVWNSWFDEQNQVMHLNGEFAPDTSYSLTVSPELKDIWGGILGQPYQLAFQTTALHPNITLNGFTGVIFLTPQDPGIIAQVANVSEVPIAVGSVSLSDFFNLNGPNAYDLRSTYQSPNQDAWQQRLNITPDRSQAVQLYLSRDQRPLNPGLYFMSINLPDKIVYGGPFLVAVSNIQLTFKLSAVDALVWAVDLRTQTPLANAPVTIFDEAGASLATGQTDASGIFKASIAPLKHTYGIYYAMIGQPGQDTFGLALSSWSEGIAPWDFGISSSYTATGPKVYLYSDRPIYRPGQTVSFRAIVRQANNGRYTLLDTKSLTIDINGVEGQPLAKFDLPLSAYGTAHGEYVLPADAMPGYYGINGTIEKYSSGIGFQVANYRKPEINLQVSFATEQIQAGQKLNASVNARYFFDAPAGNVATHWALYAESSYFYLPGYQVGPEDNSWLEAFRYPSYRGFLGELVSQGDAQTRPDGTLALEFPTELNDSRQHYTLEVTAEDESGLPVSARASAEVNPSDFYIGLRPEAWVGRAGEASGFEVVAVDWNQKPAGVRNLRGVFQKVVWVRQDPSPGASFEAPKMTPQYTEIASSDFSTDQAGKARLSFTPSEPGTYQLAVFDPQAEEGKGVRTDFTLWVGGAGRAIWPNLPNSRLQLIADRNAYRPGDTAQVFIPNPFGGDVLALITVERGIVMSHQTLTIGAEGYNFSLPITAEHAPNVYISITLLGSDTRGRPDFRQGYVNLPVDPGEQKLNVTLTSQPEKAGPGEQVTFEVLVTDSSGKPVQGEFSLAVVDLAALALADPNSPDIVTAFYSQQPNSIRLGLSLAAYPYRLSYLPGGVGGGGGAEAISVAREHFPDTAYWDAQIVTGADGKARVSVPLPDTLTTWQVEVRGLTIDTRVGQAKTQVITTKDLLVRPVVPRFLVVNDHVQLAAIVQNNSTHAMQVQVAFQGAGFVLDDPATGTLQVSLPAESRVRVEWWGVAQDVESADLTFSAQGKDSAGNSYQDAIRPASGALPVLRYIARQTFRTSGMLDAGGEVQELVSLPRSFVPGSGELSLELAPSLGAAMMKALEALEHSPYESTEQTLSRFLPNLETYRVMQQFGIDASALKARLDRTLNESLQRLQAHQNPDGGWGWWSGEASDPYMTAYVLFGLSRTREAGIVVGADLFQRTVDYLTTAYTIPVDKPLEAWQLDRLAFEGFALAEAGSGDQGKANALYQTSDQLSPWAQALLAFTIERLSPGSAEAKSLLSNLQTKAIRSATGAHWDLAESGQGWLAAHRNMQTTLSNSALVIYVLAQRDPGSPLLADAVRYLMANRQADGGWSNTYTTAWTLIALAQVMQSTGELGGKFAFSATLNGNPLAQGQAGGTEQLTPVTAQAPIKRLYTDYPNSLVIQRDPGAGRLCYVVSLNISRPVQDVTPLSQGLSITRAFYPTGEDCPDGKCDPIQSSQVGKKVNVRLTLTLPQDVYYLAVEDYIPAGAEILDLRLKTSQLGEGLEPGLEQVQPEASYDPRKPFARGWGWWLFHEPRIYDDHIAWAVDYLPAGTYELTYTMVSLQPGAYQVLPARAWQMYFPEVQANSAGSMIEIKP